MEEICGKIRFAANLGSVNLTIKNWYAITENEKESLLKYENNRLNIYLRNNKSRARNLSSVNYSSVLDSNIEIPADF